MADTFEDVAVTDTPGAAIGQTAEAVPDTPPRTAELSATPVWMAVAQRVVEDTLNKARSIDPALYDHLHDNLGVYAEGARHVANLPIAKQALGKLDDARKELQQHPWKAVPILLGAIALGGLTAAGMARRNQ